MKAYQLKIVEKNTKPPVWCRGIVPAGITFSQLSILLTAIIGRQDIAAIEFEFYQKKVRLWEEAQVRVTSSGFRYDRMDAAQMFIDDLLDSEEWFSFYYGSDSSYRVTVEARMTDYTDTYAYVKKHIGDFSRSMMVPYDSQKVNDILKEKYAVTYGEADFRKRNDILAEIGQGHCGLQGALEQKMFISPRNIKMKRWLFEKTKDDLLNYAKDLRLLRYKALNKKDLAEKIANEILRPSVMKRRLYSLNEDQILAFDEAVSAMDIYSPKPQRLEALEGLYALDYVIIYEDDTVVVLKEVAEVYEKINTTEFQEFRRKIVWMRHCLKMHAMIYGAAPIEIVHRMYRKRPGYKVDIEEWIRIFHAVPDEDNFCVIQGDKVIAKELLANDIYLDIEKTQGKKEFSIPAYREVEDCILNRYPSREPAYQKLRQFLSDRLKMDENEAKITLGTIWSYITFGSDIYDLLRMFGDEKVHFLDERAWLEFAQILKEASRCTRLLANRGNRAEELVDEEFPAFAAAGGNGPVTRSEKKIYPNDPCPCKSGKKYKKCCGRNR